MNLTSNGLMLPIICYLQSCDIYYSIIEAMRLLSVFTYFIWQVECYSVAYQQESSYITIVIISIHIKMLHNV